MGALIVLILLVLLFLFVVTLLAKTVRIVPQARAGIVERFGKYKQTSRPASTSSCRSSTRSATSSTCASRS